MLAVAKRHGFCLCESELHRSKPRALVGAVTIRLRLRPAAGTPPVVSGFKGQDRGLSIEDDFFTHGGSVCMC